MADEHSPVVDEVKIDESSINHPTTARRNSLEKHLAHRPDRTELIESKEIKTRALSVSHYW